MLKLWRAACIAAGVLFAGAQSVEATCTRHFYNHTNYMWHLQFDGPFTLAGSPCGGSSWKCDIFPGSSTEIQYSIATSVHIIGDMPYNDRYDHSFNINMEVRRPFQCGYLVHDDMSNTGAATLNDPASGDIVADYNDPYMSDALINAQKAGGLTGIAARGFAAVVQQKADFWAPYVNTPFVGAAARAAQDRNARWKAAAH